MVTHSSTASTAAPAKFSQQPQLGPLAHHHRRRLEERSSPTAEPHRPGQHGVHDRRRDVFAPEGQDFYDEEPVAPGLLVQFSAVDAVRRRQLGLRRRVKDAPISAVGPSTMSATPLDVDLGLIAFPLGDAPGRPRRAALRQAPHVVHAKAK